MKTKTKSVPIVPCVLQCGRGSPSPKITKTTLATALGRRRRLREGQARPFCSQVKSLSAIRVVYTRIRYVYSNTYNAIHYCRQIRKDIGREHCGEPLLSSTSICFYNCTTFTCTTPVMRTIRESVRLQHHTFPHDRGIESVNYVVKERNRVEKCSSSIKRNLCFLTENCFAL